VSEASYFAVAALLSAFGDNPLGIVPNMNERSFVRLSGVLDGSPAHLAEIELKEPVEPMRISKN